MSDLRSAFTLRVLPVLLVVGALSVAPATADWTTVEDHWYVVELGGAQVRFPGGDFVFEVAEGYRSAGGRIGRPVAGAVLVGRGPETLRRIDRVGAEFLLDRGAGPCD